MVGAVRAEPGEQFRRQRHPLGFQFLQGLGHGVAVMEDQQVGDQVVVLDDLQLVFAHVVLDGVGAEVDPLGELVEALAFVLGGLDGAAQFRVADVIQQEGRAHHASEFPEGEVELVLAAGRAEACA